MSRQRELKQRYKQSLPAMGVYAIRNLSTRRQLLGSSLNLNGALNRARFELAQGQHRDRQLQADWRRCGAAAFQFELVDQLKPSDRPGFDARAELDGLLALWRSELGANASGWADWPPDASALPPAGPTDAGCAP